jgi:hypothetical protein
VVNIPSGQGTVSYSVQGTDQGCNSNVVVITVSVLPQPSIGISASRTLACVGETITILASGAQTYTWSMGQTGNPQTVILPFTPGSITYSVLGTSGICTDKSSIQVSVVAVPTLIVSSNPSQICAFQHVTLVASGAASYTWNNGTVSPTIASTPTSPVTYTVTGDVAAGCSDTLAYLLPVNPLPTITASASKTVVCLPELIKLTPSGGISYTWTPGGSNGSISVTPTVTTVYTLSGTDANNCSNTATIQLRVLCNSLPEASDKNSFAVYPNPAADIICISAMAGDQFAILDPFGKIMVQVKMESATSEISIVHYPAGVYFVLLEGRNERTAIKFVRQ